MTAPTAWWRQADDCKRDINYKNAVAEHARQLSLTIRSSRRHFVAQLNPDAKVVMRRFWKISVVYALCFLLSACIGSLPPRPWFEGDKDWPSIDRFQVEIEGKQESFEFATKIHYVDESATWIYLYVNDFKRASAPIRYSVRDAYIEKENGERITPKLFITSANAKNIPPDLPWAGKIPDIAVPDKIVDPSNSGDRFGGINLRFDTPPPTATSRWVLHLGKVTVGDVGVEIPEKVIIVRGRQWHSVPVQ